MKISNLVPLSRKGFSLIETAIVLGVVGLVIGGIWVAAAAVNYQMQKQKYFGGWLTLQENVRHYANQTLACDPGQYLYYTQPTFWTLLYPTEWNEVNLSKFGWVSPEIWCDANNTRFLRLAVQGMTASFCSELITYLTVRGGADIQTQWNGCSSGSHDLLVTLAIPRN